MINPTLTGSRQYLTVSLCLIQVITGGLVPVASHAEGTPRNHDESLRHIPASISAEAIGTVESSGVALIDGQVVSGKEAIRGGELIQTSPNGSARVMIEHVGEVSLGSSAQARVASASVQTGGNTTHLLLAATILSGEMRVSLRPDTSAWVQAGGTVFTALGGAKFSAGVREGRVTIEADNGAVWNADKWAIKIPASLNTGTNPGLSDTPALIPDLSLPVPAPLPDPASAGVSSSSADSWQSRREAFIRSIRLMCVGAASDRMPSTGSGGAGQQKQYKALAGMIGLAESQGAMMIDGKTAGEKAAVWGGEMFQSPAQAGLRVTLNELGRVNLLPGSAARLSAGITGMSENASRKVLVAALARGEMQVKLHSGAFALIQAGGLAFTAFSGTSARVAVREGRTVIETTDAGVSSWAILPSGEVIQAAGQAAQAAGQLPPRRLFVRPVGLNSNIVVRARSTRQVQVQVTDENDRKIPDLPVVFLFAKGGAGSNIGSLSGATTLKASTDLNGIATRRRKIALPVNLSWLSKLLP